MAEEVPSASHTEIADDAIEGWLTKQGKHNRAWKRRYMRLIGHEIEYAPDQFKAPSGSIDLRGSKVSPRDQLGHEHIDWLGAPEDRCFVIMTPGRQYLIQAESKSEAKKWTTALQKFTDATRSQQSGPWSVVIVSAYGDAYTEYETLASHAQTRTIVKTTHRYSSLLKLHETIMSKFGAQIEGLQFPPKKIFGNKEPGFIDRRRTALNCYLLAVMSIPAIAQSRIVREALGLKEAGIPAEAAHWLAQVRKSGREEDPSHVDEFRSVPMYRRPQNCELPVYLSINVQCSEIPLLSDGSRPDTRFVLFVSDIDDRWQKTSESAVIPTSTQPSLINAFRIKYIFARSTKIKVVVQQTQPSDNSEGKDTFVDASYITVSLTDTINNTFSARLQPVKKSSSAAALSEDARKGANSSGGESEDPSDSSGSSRLDFQPISTPSSTMKTHTGSLASISPRPAVHGRIRLTSTQTHLSRRVLQLRLRVDDHTPQSKNAVFFFQFAVPGHGSAQSTTYDRVYSSPPSSSMAWDEVEFDAGLLSRKGDANQPLKISVYSREKSVSQLLGSITTTLLKLVQGGCNQRLPMRIANEAAWTLVVESVNIPFVPGVLDYMTVGASVDVLFGVDFTASNGFLGAKTSLHKGSTTQLNRYSFCMTAVVNALAAYNSSDKIYAFGYGAKLPDNGGTASHCFPLTLDWNEPGVSTVKELVEVYHSTSEKITFHGTSDITEVVEEGMQRAKAAMKRPPVHYQVLVVITDGVSNIESIERCLRRMDDLPMSLAILGIGPADFGPLKILSDQGAKGVKRNALQFLNMKQLYSDAADEFTMPQMLTDELLKKTGEQFEMWMHAHGDAPSGQPRRSLKPLFVDDDVASTDDSELMMELTRGTGEDDDRPDDPPMATSPLLSTLIPPK